MAKSDTLGYILPRPVGRPIDQPLRTPKNLIRDVLHEIKLARRKGGQARKT